LIPVVPAGKTAIFKVGRVGVFLASTADGIVANSRPSWSVDWVVFLDVGPAVVVG